MRSAKSGPDTRLHAITYAHMSTQSSMTIALHPKGLRVKNEDVSTLLNQAFSNVPRVYIEDLKKKSKSFMINIVQNL